MEKIPLVTFTPIATGYSPIVMSLIDHSTYETLGGSGGWQVVDRPKAVAATQWYDRAPFQLQMTCILDNGITKGIGQSGTSVEEDCSTLETWLDAITGTVEPPVFQITGPFPSNAINKKWILFSISFLDAIRDNTSGNRIQQQVRITIYEYNPPVSTPSPAAAQSSGTVNALATTGRTQYTIKKGDSAAKIAANLGLTGTPAKTFITNLTGINGGKFKTIGDPKSWAGLVGQTITLPGH